MPTLETIVDGLKFPNGRFVIGSGPPSTNATIINKAFAAGWGGVVAKTTALTDTPVVNVQPRYGKLRTPGKENVGFQNIELQSDRPFEDWEDDFKRVKDTSLTFSCIGSIMESFDTGHREEVAARSLAAGCDALGLSSRVLMDSREAEWAQRWVSDPERVETVTRWVVEAANGAPVWSKMTPNITDITKPSRAALNGGGPTGCVPSTPSWLASGST